MRLSRVRSVRKAGVGQPPDFDANRTVCILDLLTASDCSPGRLPLRVSSPIEAPGLVLARSERHTRHASDAPGGLRMERHIALPIEVHARDYLDQSYDPCTRPEGRLRATCEAAACPLKHPRQSPCVPAHISSGWLW